MPDEPTAPVLEAPAVPTPDLEAVPTPAQEPSAQADESETPEQPDEAEVDPIELLAELTAGLDDEAKAKIREKLGGGPADVSEERVQWELEKATEERSQIVPAAVAYEQNRVQQVGGQLQGYLAQLNDNIQEAAKKLQDGEITDAGMVRFDPSDIAARLWPLVQDAQIARALTVASNAQASFREAVETHAVYRHMDATTRKAFREAIGKFDWKGAAVAALDAGLRAAPEEISRKAQADAEKKAALMDKAAKIREALGTNSRKSLTSATGQNNWRTKAEARALHVQDKITSAEMRRINADPAIPEM